MSHNLMNFDPLNPSKEVYLHLSLVE